MKTYFKSDRHEALDRRMPEVPDTRWQHPAPDRSSWLGQVLLALWLRLTGPKKRQKGFTLMELLVWLAGLLGLALFFLRIFWRQ